MRLARLFREDLGDQDEFGPQCGFCVAYNHGGPDHDFHSAHQEAVKAAYNKSGGRAPQRADWTNNFHEIFNVEMNKLGYVREGGWKQGKSTAHGIWIRKPLKEDLGDKDEFGFCPFSDCSQREDEPEFHAAHVAASMALDRDWRILDFIQSRKGDERLSNVFNQTMAKHGYVRNGLTGRWDKKPLKEALEDKDEFGYIKVVTKYRRTHENIESPQYPKLDPAPRRTTPKIIDYIYKFEDGALLFYEKFIAGNTEENPELSRDRSRVRFKDVSGGTYDLPPSFRGLPTEYIDGIRNFRVDVIHGPASWRKELDVASFGPEQDKLWQEVMGS